MRFLADENVELAVVMRLTEAGHDVTRPPTSQGLADSVVLDLANAENRVLLTNDKDFAELAFLQRQASAGIALIRLPQASALDKAKRVAEVVDAEGERLVAVFTVIEPSAIRRRPFLRGD